MLASVYALYTIHAPLLSCTSAADGAIPVQHVLHQMLCATHVMKAAVPWAASLLVGASARNGCQRCHCTLLLALLYCLLLCDLVDDMPEPCVVQYCLPMALGLLAQTAAGVLQ